MSNGHGGKRPGAGRKKKTEELDMIENLNKHIGDDMVFKMLRDRIKKGDVRAATLYLQYKYGKAVDRKDVVSENANIDLSVTKTYTETKKDEKKDDNQDKGIGGPHLKIG